MSVGDGEGIRTRRDHYLLPSLTDQRDDSVLQACVCNYWIDTGVAMTDYVFACTAGWADSVPTSVLDKDDETVSSTQVPSRGPCWGCSF